IILRGSMRSYIAEDLIDAITLARRGKSFDCLTRTCGFRETVERLFDEEIRSLERVDSGLKT
ncbi:MAG: hypothetical protein V1685_05150, partial [Parcubacteria group bacterium]